MSKPFAVLVAERAKKPQDVIAAEVTQRLANWAQVSSRKNVSLDDVAWLGAMFDIAFKKAKAQIDQAQAVKKQLEEKIQARQPKVHTVVMTDGVSTRDSAGG